MAEVDYKECARQMRSDAVKTDENGNILCSPVLWERIASVIENAQPLKASRQKHPKCGDCAYAKPTTWGGKPTNTYVECANEEHVKKYCKHAISRIRQKTHPACKSYKEKNDGKIGYNLKRIMKEKGYTQDKLAEKMKTSQGAISSLVNNKRRPKIMMVRRIAEALEVSVDDLFEEVM